MGKLRLCDVNERCPIESPRTRGQVFADVLFYLIVLFQFTVCHGFRFSAKCLSRSSRLTCNDFNGFN